MCQAVFQVLVQLKTDETKQSKIVELIERLLQKSLKIC
jgi:hypothetical protein